VRPSVSSSNVKFCQVLSSFFKPLLDGALCNFNDLPEPSLTAAPRRNLGRPTPLRSVAGDETKDSAAFAAGKEFVRGVTTECALTRGAERWAGSAVDLASLDFPSAPSR